MSRIFAPSKARMDPIHLKTEFNKRKNWLATDNSLLQFKVVLSKPILKDAVGFSVYYWVESKQMTSFSIWPSYLPFPYKLITENK